jgi:membrane-bound ClpP family serine protease
MSTNQPSRWNFTYHSALAVAALILFILAALSYHGTITGVSGAVLLAIGLACLAAEGI